MKYPNQIECKVYGRNALFTDPLTKIGGEKFSYQVPTYQALKGIMESIYWKPTFVWIIDDVRVMKPIQTESKGIRPIKYNGKNELATYTYLKDVEYHIRAHFEWNDNRLDLIQDRNEHKHYDIAKRMVERGGRRDVFLGTRECQAYVEPCVFEEGEGYYDNMDLSFGIMVHGITYPDEAICEKEKENMTVRLWNAQMKKGVIHFIEPKKCEIRRILGPMKMKAFNEYNFSGLEEFEGGGAFGLDENA